MCKSLSTLRRALMGLTAAAACSWTPRVSAESIMENINSTTYIDSRNNTNNYSGGTNKMKLVANADGGTNASNDGSGDRGLFSLPTDLTSPTSPNYIPPSEIASAKIYFYAYSLSPPNYNNGVTTDPNPPAYAPPNMTLYPLTQSFTLGTATWNSPVGSSTQWSAPWVMGSGGNSPSGPYAATVNGVSAAVNGVSTAVGGLPATYAWSSFDVTSLWQNDPSFANDGAVLMLSNENVPYDPNPGYTNIHIWETQGWATLHYIPGGSDVLSPLGSCTPYLVVNTVPEPSTLALLLGGAATLALALGKRWGRRRRPFGAAE